jgi:hypothetical protein
MDKGMKKRIFEMNFGGKMVGTGKGNVKIVKLWALNYIEHSFVCLLCQALIFHRRH